ncbi:MAG: helix-turn-helix transcriptional regulator [Solirubrobacterales bacterium]
MRLDRLLAIVILLVNRKSIRARELAELFEVSERTIFRDIEAINQAGIPVITTPGARGGIGLAENYRIEQSLLALDDVAAILGALKGLKTTFDDAGLAQTIEKIQGLVPHARLDELAGKSERLVIDLKPWGGNEAVRKRIALIKEAIEAQRLIRFGYTGPEGERTERVMEPYRLLLKSQNWYVYGFCALRQDFRLFRVSRIRNLQLEGDFFTPRENPAGDYPWETEFLAIETTDVVLRFRPELRILAEEHFQGTPIDEEADGSVIVRISLPVNEWLYGMIFSYAQGVEVLRPPEVRRGVQERLAAMEKIYQRP